MKITDFNVRVAKRQKSKNREQTIADISTTIRNADKELEGELYKMIRNKKK